MGLPHPLYTPPSDQLHSPASAQSLCLFPADNMLESALGNRQSSTLEPLTLHIPPAYPPSLYFNFPMQFQQPSVALCEYRVLAPPAE